MDPKSASKALRLKLDLDSRPQTAPFQELIDPVDPKEVFKVLQSKLNLDLWPETRPFSTKPPLWIQKACRKLLDRN